MTQIHDPRPAAAHAAAPHAAHPSYGPPLPPPPAFAPQPAFAPTPPPRRTGLIVGSSLAAVLLAGGLTVGAVLLFGEGSLDTVRAEAAIATLVEDQVGVAPTSVECPTDVPLAAGTTTSCTVTLQGQTYDYVVEQTDDEGTVTFSSDAVYVQVADIEALLSEQITAEAGVSAESTCDAGERTVLVAADGLQVPCTVSAVGNPTDSAEVTALVDAEGVVTFQFV